MWDFLFISLSDNWSTELKCFFMTLWEARKPCEAKSKATICLALFDETFSRIWSERSFSPGRRSATFECWVYHFQLNNPLSACISYSNKSMKSEIWKLNLELNRMCDFVVYCFCLLFFRRGHCSYPSSSTSDNMCPGRFLGDTAIRIILHRCMPPN